MYFILKKYSENYLYILFYLKNKNTVTFEKQNLSIILCGWVIWNEKFGRKTHHSCSRNLKETWYHNTHIAVNVRAHYIQINQSVDCTLKIFLTVTRYAQTNAFLNDRSGVLLKGNIKRDKVFWRKDGDGPKRHELSSSHETKYSGNQRKRKEKNPYILNVSKNN